MLKIGLLAAATLALSAALSPVSAAQTPITQAFLANAKANARFLDQSSRIALAHVDSAPVLAFARGEADEQGRTAVALGEGYSAGRLVADAQDPGQGLQTGRSAAAAAPAAANGRPALGAEDLAKLEGLSGRAFEDAYWVNQLDALKQLESDYRAYLHNGDDAALVALARAELPKVTRHLWQLTKI